MTASILVCRRIFPDVVARLREHFEVESNDADDVWSRDELIRRLQGKDGVFVTGTQAIDAALLDACPRLRAVCSPLRSATTTSTCRRAPRAASR